MRIMAIDPGPTHSAFVVWDGITLLDFGKHENLEMLAIVRGLKGWQTNAPVVTVLVIEMIASYGMPVGAEVFETCVWIGRFMERHGCTRTQSRLTRIEVKSHLCHSAKATDANIRQALIDRFGGKQKALGCKRDPGPLRGVTGDCWAALAVAVTYWDKQHAEIAKVG